MCIYVMQHRSRSRSPHHGTYAVSSVQELAPRDDVSQTAVGSEPKVLWLVDQTKDGYPGYWREAKRFALSLEQQFQNGDEQVEGLLDVGGGVLQFYRHDMINGAEMRQIRFSDEKRSQEMFHRRLARVTMQTSRDDQSRPRK